MGEDICVTRFREYIRINTMQPNPDYGAADTFLKKYGAEIGLEYSSIECVKGKYEKRSKYLHVCNIFRSILSYPIFQK